MIIQLPLCQYTYPLYHSYPIMEHTYNTFILKTLEREKNQEEILYNCFCVPCITI